MFRETLIVAVMIAVPLGAAGVAMAQSGVEVEQQAPAPPKFEIIRPEAKGSEITRPRDADIYIGDPVLNYDPAFIAPFTKETETGRMGLAGWTSPVGVVTFDAPQNRREPGWLSFGFAITWGGPVRKTAATPTTTPAPTPR
jgi:hypothetical protein